MNFMSFLKIIFPDCRGEELWSFLVLFVGVVDNKKMILFSLGLNSNLVIGDIKSMLLLKKKK